MLKRHKKYKRKSKLYSLIVLFIGLLICLFDIGYKFYSEYLNNKKVNNFINNIEKTYIGVLEIPKIKLKKGFYSFDNINNDVSKGIEIIEKSDMPNIKNGTLILAAHSGNGQMSYFNNLNKLSLGDIVYIYYEKNKYKYKLIDTYEIEKTGRLELKNNYNITSLVLITCNKNDDTKQIVYINKLITVL